MDRKSIVITDKASHEVADLRKALVSAGYDVRLINSAAQTLALMDELRPNLILAEVRLPEMDGPHLLQELRSRPATQEVPFVLMGRLKTVEERVNVMRLPIDDYLQKPIDVAEAVVRIENLIKDAELFSAAPRPRVRGFNGNLTEMNLVDLLQTIEVGQKTCIIRLRSNGQEGTVYVTAGEVIDAELDTLEARRALLRMFTWNEGTFQVELKLHERPRMLTVPMRDLISEGLTRLDRWSRLAGQMPPLHTCITPTPPAATAALEEEEQAVLALLQGEAAKCLREVVEENPADDLRTLTLLKRLYDRGLLQISDLPPERKNGDYLERLRERRNFRTNGATGLGAALEFMLAPAEEHSPRQIERRRVERRHPFDRRQADRRRGFNPRERGRVYLKRSELLMIREKLLR